MGEDRKNSKRRRAARGPSRATVARWFDDARQGEAAAIANLLELYRRLLLKEAHKLLDSDLRKKVASSDLVQNTLLKAMVAFPTSKFTNLAKFVAWLKAILANEFIEAVRWYRLAEKRNDRRERSLEHPLSRQWLYQLADASSKGQSAGEDRHGQLLQLRAALHRLPSHYRRIIQWRAFDGLMFRDIAARLDRTEDAVRMLWTRAIKRLQNEYGNREPP